MGPQHPATHGVLRVILKLDGEKVLGTECVIGYLHRGVEKIAEHRTYTMFNPYVDRMDYVAAVSNGLGYCEAVEKLLNVEAPRRAQYIRVILTELNRLASHMLWLGTHALDIGAITPLFYTFRDREEILKIFEKYCGARLTTHAFRIGGCSYETYEGFEREVKKFLDFVTPKIDEYEELLTTNRIWIERTKDVGKISAKECIALGVTGPVLRASGVKWDLRKAQPYAAYADFDFEIPVGQNGDTYDRYMVRMQEMRQSLRIIDQALWERVNTRLQAFKDSYHAKKRPGLLPRSETSKFLFSGLLKCGQCGGNLAIVAGGGKEQYRKYGCSQHWYRGACSNNLLERQIWLEKRLLADLQTEILKPEALEYTIAQFGDQLKTTLGRLSGELAQMRERKRAIEVELRRLTETAALTGPSTFLIQAINEREQELRQITDKLLSTGPESIDSRLDEIRLFVTKKLSDIRELLARHESADPVAVRTELRKHVSEIRMTPQPGARRPHYLAEGAWDLIGKETGPHHEAAPLSIRMVAGVGFEPTTSGSVAREVNLTTALLGVAYDHMTPLFFAELYLRCP